MMLWKDFCEDYIKSGSYICDLHFLALDFVDAQRLELKDNAVPSILGSKQRNSMFLHNRQVKLNKKVPYETDCLASNIQSNVVGDTSEKTDNEHSYSNLILSSTCAKKPDTKLNRQSTSKIYVEVLAKKSLTEPGEPNSAVKRKSSTHLNEIPLKVYKTIQKDIEVEFQPEIMTPMEEIGEHLSKFDKQNSFSWTKRIFDQDCALKNVEINFKSTMNFEFEAIDKEYSPSLVGLSESNTNSSSELHRNDIHSQTDKLSNQKSQSSSPSYEKTDLKQNSCLLALVAPHTEMLPKGLQKHLDEINKTLKKQIPCYRNKPLNKKANHPHLDINNPKYSIAATAESLGTFNSFVEESLKDVSLFAGEWCNLYEPSQIKFPKLSEPQIGLMVQYLRSKLVELNGRDKLDVLFLLSMMSIYPNAPKHIKELLSQRLNLVYIAKLFNWDTALSLGFSFCDKKQKNYSFSLSKENTVVANEKCFDASNGTSSLHSLHSVNNDGSYFNNEQTTEDNVSKLAKQPEFAFEIVIQEKSYQQKKVIKKRSLSNS